MQFKILNFRGKTWIFCPLALIFSVKVFRSKLDLVLLKLHIRPSLNQFIMFVL